MCQCRTTHTHCCLQAHQQQHVRSTCTVNSKKSCGSSGMGRVTRLRRSRRSPSDTQHTSRSLCMKVRCCVIRALTHLWMSRMTTHSMAVAAADRGRHVLNTTRVFCQTKLRIETWSLALSPTQCWRSSIQLTPQAATGTARPCRYESLDLLRCETQRRCVSIHLPIKVAVVQYARVR